MERDELTGLWSIQPIANLDSIAVLGILSHNAAAKVPHVDISMPEVQDIRSGKRVPDSQLPRGEWRELHDYANLYFCPRNPMLYKRLDQRHELAVLRIDVEVLDIEGVVVTDGNAGSGPTRFLSAEAGLAAIEADVNFAKLWIHADPYEMAEHKRRMCAEVLVPDSVPPELIIGAYVCSVEAKDECADLPWATEINGYTFFG